MYLCVFVSGLQPEKYQAEGNSLPHLQSRNLVQVDGSILSGRGKKDKEAADLSRGKPKSKCYAVTSFI